MESRDAQRVLVQAERSGEELEIRNAGRNRRLSLRHGDANERALVAGHINGQNTIAELLPEPRLTVRNLDVTLGDNRPPCAERIVSGAEHLVCRREASEPPGRPRTAGRPDPG